MDFGEDEIRSITESVWTSVLGLEVQSCPEWVAAPDEQGLMTGVVAISGAWGGLVVLQCPLALARRAAAIMFDVEIDAATAEQTRDALGELTNMTGGNLKSLLPEPCDLALPEVTGVTEVPRGRLALRVAFECNGEAFAVSVIETASGPAEAAERV
jgi:chemotaxis protein CheX